MEAAAEPDGQHHAGLTCRRDCGSRAGQVECYRLLDQDVLAGLRRTLDLLRMLAVRGSQHNRVDGAVGKHRVEVVHQANTVVAAELLRTAARAGVTNDEMNLRI